MAEFAPVVVRRQSLLAPARATAEEKLWGTYKRLTSETLPGVVNGVAFSPRFPYEMAAAADYSVSLINSTVGEVRKTIGRFKDVAHSPCFKPDGKLLVAGCGNGVAQVFDLSNRSILRQFKGHTGAVWTSKFSADGLRVYTGSDDFSVRMWDLPTGKCVTTIKECTDYVRAQASSPTSKHVWCFGSYDRKARVYDMLSNRVIFTLDHGAQIDDMIMLPGGVRAVTVGGTYVNVWDFLTGGKCQFRLSNHAKAVTCCALHPSHDRILTAGLDGQVKVHELSTFSVSAAMYYDEAILSLAVSADGKRIGTGSLNGCAEIRVAKTFQKGLPPAPAHGGLKERQFEGWGSGFEKPKRDGPKPGTRRYFERGAYSKPDESDISIGVKSSKSMKPYDRYLRSFSHGRALGAAAKTRDPAVLISVVEELASRKALSNAMLSCTPDAIHDQMYAIMKNIDLPIFTGRMIQLLNILIDVRGGEFGEGHPIDDILTQILRKVKKQVQVGRSLTQLQGMLEMVMNVANL